MLLHPSVSYEDRDSLAVSGNEIAETTNKTTFLDRCVMVYKKIKEGKTIKAIHGVLEIRGATMMDMVAQTKETKCYPGCG